MIIKIMLTIFNGVMAILIAMKSRKIKSNFELSFYVVYFIAFLLNIYFTWR